LLTTFSTKGTLSTVSTGIYCAAITGLTAEIFTSRTPGSGSPTTLGLTAHSWRATHGGFAATPSHAGAGIIFSPGPDALGVPGGIVTDFAGRAFYVETRVINALAGDALESRRADDACALGSAHPVTAGAVLRAFNIEAGVRHTFTTDAAMIQGT